MCVFASALERKLNEAETEKFNIKQMKDLFEQKAAQLATEIVGVCDGGTMMHTVTELLLISVYLSCKCKALFSDELQVRLLSFIVDVLIFESGVYLLCCEDHKSVIIDRHKVPL